MPLTASTAPPASRRAAARTASSGAAMSIGAPPAASSSLTLGPQTGQAFGWAWKRRSAGSSYSAWHAAHIAKPAIVVAGRSYGTPRTIVKRGPQFVQFTNG